VAEQDSAAATVSGVAEKVHQFYAIAFEENLSLKQLSSIFPAAKLSPHELYQSLDRGGGLYIYPFGAIVFHNVSEARRENEIARLHDAVPGLTTQIVREEYTVVENAGPQIGVLDGKLVVDVLTQARASIIALTVAQSAAMEYYERIVEQLFARTTSLVERLEERGTVPLLTRPLHRFIGGAINTRNEVLSVLHLLDRPDAAWEDFAMARIYDELRAEFDLADRYTAMELKLGSIQEALELVLDVARDRRLVVLEGTIVVLIVLELLLTLLRVH
jgi:uncharacterized Rmd1/YagE family protein